MFHMSLREMPPPSIRQRQPRDSSSLTPPDFRHAVTVIYAFAYQILDTLLLALMMARRGDITPC